MSIEVEKTMFLELPDGKNIPVKNLDPRIQQHVELYDKLREDVTEKHYELQVYQAALQLKKQVIENLVNSVYGKQEEDGQSNSSEEEVSERPAPKKKKAKAKAKTDKSSETK